MCFGSTNKQVKMKQQTLAMASDHGQGFEQ
ncbi:MAG: hypothetical protein JWP29_3399, partial [Rhodoferax sp.]|nr:hypothetical protein [Rhodoferax sp.]